MKRALAAVLFVLGMIVVPAATASAASCDARSSGQVSGGYVVTLWCSGAGFVDGYGSTLTDANREALLLYQIYVDYGIDCGGRGTSAATGGRVVTLWCSSGGFIDGYGSTLTDAQVEARELVVLLGEKGQDCSGRGVGRVSGGYVVTLWCTRGGFIDGRGSTVTGAAQNARFAASIA
ncbi:hypothetical protein LWC34_40045 [Kibdelosporangium philippinense]|uniref:Serine/threonine protein kinase n=1 Tax=Kibdelosporangium philippinense TaxID=211113 RepID=A0ABS8ZN38_9PSEU|nr:hypothetical protein [Kibdelosporangium philippinense]MCE7008962.1 hypothetical protein [Kibdelosporangium philippinense]